MNPPTYSELLDALRQAEQAMNYLGDILNDNDMVEAADEKFVNPIFKLVQATLDKADDEEAQR